MNATTTDTAPRYDPYPIDIKSLARLFIIGVATGVLGWLVYMAISQFFIEPVFCRSAETFTVCKNGGTIAWVSAHIIVLAAATAALARLGVYRPLLIVLGVLVALWGAHSWLGGLEWYAALLWQGLLFGIAVALFGWIARIPNFVFAVLLTIGAALLARVVLMLA